MLVLDSSMPFKAVTQVPILFAVGSAPCCSKTTGIVRGAFFWKYAIVAWEMCQEPGPVVLQNWSEWLSCKPLCVAGGWLVTLCKHFVRMTKLAARAIADGGKRCPQQW